MPDEKIERGRLAIECLMLYMEPGKAAREAAGRHIAELASDPNIGTEKLLAGFLDLSMFLVFNLAKDLGAGEESESVVEKSRQILQTISMKQFPRAE